MKTPFDLFFKLGDKITKGDIKRKTDFDYYFLWIMFIAFFTLFISYLLKFINSNNITFYAFGSDNPGSNDRRRLQICN